MGAMHGLSDGRMLQDTSAQRVYGWREGCLEEEHESSAVFFADVLVENGGLEGIFRTFFLCCNKPQLQLPALYSRGNTSVTKWESKD